MALGHRPLLRPRCFVPGSWCMKSAVSGESHGSKRDERGGGGGGGKKIRSTVKRYLHLFEKK